MVTLTTGLPVQQHDLDGISGSAAALHSVAGPPNAGCLLNMSPASREARRPVRATGPEPQRA